MSVAQPTTEALELRVLSGVHAGARAPVEAVLRVGSDVDADIVLRDARIAAAATLAADADGWTWTSPEAPPRRLRLGEGLRLGAVLITVERGDAPWPDVATVAVLEGEDEERDPAEDEAGGEAVAAASRAVADAPAAEGGHRPAPATAKPPPMVADAPPPAPRRAARSVPWPARIALALLAFAVLAVALVLALAPAPAAAPPRAVPAAYDRAGIDAVLAELGVAATVRFEQRDDGAGALRGVVDDEARRDALAAALVRFTPRPALAVMTRADLLVLARDLAQGAAPDLDVAAVGALGLRLTGVAASREAVDLALGRLQRELPPGVAVEDAVRLPADLVAAFRAELARSGLSDLEVAWADGHMTVDGKVDRDGARRWERLLLDFNRRYGAYVPFTARVDAPLLRREAPQQVVAVVGGATPFAVLAGGRKVLVGGRVGDFELREVRDHAMVWDDGSGEPVVTVAR